MAKKSVSAKAIIADIRSGVGDFEIMRQHGLSPSQLSSVLDRLVQAGHLTREEIDARRPKKEAKLCPYCSAEVAGDAIRCARCGKMIDGRPAPVPPEGEFPVARHTEEEAWESTENCPWEERASLGWVQAFIKTVIACLFSPTAFFSALPVGRGYMGPFLFATATVALGYAMTPVWSLLFKSGFGLGRFLLSLLGLLVMTPLVVAIGFGIGALLNHLSLMLLGAAKKDFEATFSVVCYAAASQLFSVVPFIGSVVGAIWGLVVMVIGLREVHKTSTGQAILAVLLPVLLCIGLAALLATAMFSAMAGAMMGQMGPPR